MPAAYKNMIPVILSVYFTVATKCRCYVASFDSGTLRDSSHQI
jgi:hypothetical protein